MHAWVVFADIGETPVRTETWVLRRPDEDEDERVGCDDVPGTNREGG